MGAAIAFLTNSAHRVVKHRDVLEHYHLRHSRVSYRYDAEFPHLMNGEKAAEDGIAIDRCVGSDYVAFQLPPATPVRSQFELAHVVGIAPVRSGILSSR